MNTYPEVAERNKVGTYDLHCKTGGGYVWDDVLEYRVWAKRTNGELECHAYSSAKDAEKKAVKLFKNRKVQYVHLVALIVQHGYVDEPEPGNQFWVPEDRITEWRLDWLTDENKTHPLKPAK